ncbi:MAG TPA: cation transporter [Verrucomicrobiae bacterium]
MKSLKTLAIVAALSLIPASMAMAETKVKLTNVHLCCGSCVKGIESSVSKVEGATVVASQDDGTVTVTAKDDDTAKKAVNAVGKAGYYGKSDHAKIKINNDKIDDTKVASLKITGLHLCCGKCVKAFDAAVKKVDGVTEHNAENKGKEATIKGNFSPKALIASLNEAGLNAKLEKDKEKK